MSQGPSEHQVAIDALLAEWAMLTHGMHQHGYTRRMRHAMHECAGPDPETYIARYRMGKLICIEPGITARGRDKSANGPVRIGDAPAQRTTARLAADLMVENRGQYQLLCAHYGARGWLDEYTMPIDERAWEVFGISVGAYRNRVTLLRRWFIERWPAPADKIVAESG